MATTWQLLFKTATSANPSMGEFILAATPGGPSLFTGGTAAASSTYSAGYTPSLAFDNNPATLWSGLGATPAWLQYSPTTEISPVELRLTARGDGSIDGSPVTFDLQSDKATPGTFVTVQSYTAASWTSGQTQTFAVAAPVAATAARSNRYWRVNIAANADNAGPVIETITMATAAGGTNLITQQASCSAQTFVDAAYGPGLVVVGVAGQWGANAVVPQWWQYDLGVGQAASVNNFTFATSSGRAGRAPTQFTIASSADGVTFTDEWSGTFPAWVDTDTKSTSFPAPGPAAAVQPTSATVAQTSKTIAGVTLTPALQISQAYMLVASVIPPPTIKASQTAKIVAGVTLAPTLQVSQAYMLVACSTATPTPTPPPVVVVVSATRRVQIMLL